MAEVFSPRRPEGDGAKKETGEVTAPVKKLSPAQMRESVGNTMTEIRSMLTRLVELRKLARQSQDVIKLNCVNDKMLLFKQLVNIAEDAQTSMTESNRPGRRPGALPLLRAGRSVQREGRNSPL